MPALAKDIFLKGEKGYALLVSANGAGALLGALFVAYIGNSPKKRNIMNLGIYFFSVMLFLLSFSRIYLLSLLLIMGAGMGLVTYFSCASTLIQSNVEDSIRGRVMGIWALIFGGMTPLGCLFAGIFVQSNKSKKAKGIIGAIFGSTFGVLIIVALSNDRLVTRIWDNPEFVLGIITGLAVGILAVIILKKIAKHKQKQLEMLEADDN